MEPISTVASFVTIAEVLRRLYKKLRYYAKAVAVAAAEAKELAKEVNHFVELLLLVEDVLGNVREVIQRSRRYMEVERKQCASADELVFDLRDLISDLRDRVNEGQGSLLKRFKMGRKLAAMKSNFHHIQCSVERSKSSLSIFLAVVQVEHNKAILERLERQCTAERQQYSKEIEFMKRKM